MTLLQIFFIISGLIISIFAIEIAKKQKFNALHFFVFIFIGFGLLIFTFFPKIIDKIGGIFGAQRGVDVLLYSSVIFLVYFVLLLLRKAEFNSENLTRLVRENSIYYSSQKQIDGNEVFVIPSYNEAKILINTISNIFKNGYKNIIVVNDGSDDNTSFILEEKFGDKIILLNHFINRGQGAALETGFEYIRRFGNINYVVTYDADGQHDINDMKNFEEYIRKNQDIDVFLGSRFLGKKIYKEIPFIRKIILKLGIVFTFFLSNINLTDTHNGYRVLRKNVLGKIKISIDGMGHASEVLDIISQNNIKYIEVPVNIKYTDYSLNKGQSAGNSIKIAFRFIRNKFFK